MRRIDLTGRLFGRWVVLSYAGRGTSTCWNCRCSCGVERTVTAPNLTSGKSKSCGCLRVELAVSLATRRVPMPQGNKNYSVIAAKQKHGSNYVSSKDVWYRRAASVFYKAHTEGLIVGFSTAMEFATYIRSIAPQNCPVFGHTFVDRGHGFSKWSPSIDKINPAQGYTPGNIQIISMFANKMKQDATPKELQQFAEWALALNN